MFPSRETTCWEELVTMVTPKRKIVHLVTCRLFVRVPIPSFFISSNSLRHIMAFFGLTHLGYQNPIGDKMIVNPRGASHPEDGVSNGEERAGLPPSLQEPQGPLKCTDICNVYHQPIPYSTDIHHGSHERYKEMVKRVQTPRSPKQLYKMPLTDSQQYGWMTSKSPEPWTQVKRFPRKNSEMTKFVKEMTVTDQEFSLF